jgi:hypothetical protein
MWVLKEALIKVGKASLGEFARIDVSGALTGEPARVRDAVVRLHRHAEVTLGTATLGILDRVVTRKVPLEPYRS